MSIFKVSRTVLTSQTFEENHSWTYFTYRKPYRYILLLERLDLYTHLHRNRWMRHSVGSYTCLGIHGCIRDNTYSDYNLEADIKMYFCVNCLCKLQQIKLLFYQMWNNFRANCLWRVAIFFGGIWFPRLLFLKTFGLIWVSSLNSMPDNLNLLTLRNRKICIAEKYFFFGVNVLVLRQSQVNCSLVSKPFYFKKIVVVQGDINLLLIAFMFTNCISEFVLFWPFSLLYILYWNLPITFISQISIDVNE